MNVEEAMTKGVVTIEKNQKLTDATTKMKKNKISRLIVTDKGEVTGILSKKDIASHLGSGKHGNRLPTSLHVSTVAKGDLVTIGKDAPMEEAARLMSTNNISSVVVMEGKDPLGIITTTDIARQLQDSQVEVSSVMGPVHRVSPTDRAVHARRIMMDSACDRVVVVDDSAGIAGILTQKDLAHALEQFKKDADKYQEARLKNLPVGDIMRTGVYSLDASATVGDVCSTMIKKRISGVPILEEGRLKGMVTKMEVLKVLQ